MQMKELIATAKRNQKVTSEQALGKLLGVSGVTVMSWRREMTKPKPEHAAHLADLAGLDPVTVVAELLEESAEDPLLRSVYARLKRGIAAALTICIALPAWLQAASQNCILCKITRHRLC